MTADNMGLDVRPAKIHHMHNKYKALGGQSYLDQNGEAFVILKREERRENLTIDAAIGVLNKFLRDDNFTVSKHIRDEMKDELRSIAEGEERRTTHRRFAAHEGDLYLDLGDPTWRAVHCTRAGWRIVENPPVLFARGPDMLPLPEPTRDGSIDQLMQLVNIPDEKNLFLYVGWLVTALNPKMECPILAFSGDSGACKTSAMLAARGIIDPTRVPEGFPPKSEDQLMVQCVHNGVLSFDNLSFLSGEMSDFLCCVVTGGALSKRTLYSNGGLSSYSFRRPIVLNGIPDLAERQDLIARLLSVRMVRRATWKSKTKWLKELEQARPGILGVLLDAACRGLSYLDDDDDEGESAHRVADFAKWTAACAPGLPRCATRAERDAWAARFSAYYSDNESSAQKLALSTETLPIYLQRFLKKRGKKADAGQARHLLVVWDRRGARRALPRARLPGQERQRHKPQAEPAGGSSPVHGRGRHAAPGGEQDERGDYRASLYVLKNAITRRW